MPFEQGTPDPVLIADVYKRLADAKKSNQVIDNIQEANGLSMAARFLGTRPRQIALVPADAPDVEQAYRKAGFQTITMNGDRPTKLMSFLLDEMRNLWSMKPKHLVMVTNDPAFEMLASNAIRGNAQVSIWAPGSVPAELMNPQYAYRPLEELLPDTRIKEARVVVYLDYENLHIGLERAGYSPTPKILVEAVRAAVTDLGKVVDIIAYADWHELMKGSELNVQRELEILDVRTHYKISRHGKNSADMALANDIRTRIGRGENDPDAVDVVVLGTRDRDFTAIVKEAQKTKKVVILGLRGEVSQDLESAAEVRYLGLAKQPAKKSPFTTSKGQFALLMRTATYLQGKKRSWEFVDRLAANVAPESGGDALLRQAVKEGLLRVKHPKTPNMLQLDWNHPDAFFASWLVDRLDYCLQQRKMPYVDTNFLARGMKLNERLQKLGIGQNWHDAKEALLRAQETGCVVLRRQENPKNQDRLIETWWLVNQSQEDGETAAAQHNPTSDAQTADSTHQGATHLPQESLPTEKKDIRSF